MLTEKSQQETRRNVPAAAIPGQPVTAGPAPGQADALATGTRALLVRVQLVNTSLRQGAADTTEAGELARSCSVQIRALQAMVLAGNPAGIRSAASRLGMTLRMLRDTYLRLIGTGSLPKETVIATRAVVLSLESAACGLDTTVTALKTRPGRMAAGSRHALPVSRGSRAPHPTATVITPAREVSALM